MGYSCWDQSEILILSSSTDRVCVCVSLSPCGFKLYFRVISQIYTLTLCSINNGVEFNYMTCLFMLALGLVILLNLTPQFNTLSLCAGYTGKNCQFETDPCSPSQCMNGGTCVGNSTHFR